MAFPWLSQELLHIIERFAITYILALIYGLQRQKSHKPIGFGTFIFVATGACALAITATSLGLDKAVPLMAAIVSGIGFLGAGALIRSNDKIFGFTTAASIWLFAIFGLIIGLGNYATGLTIYAFIWITVLFDSYLEKKSIGSYQKKIMITTSKIVNEIDIKKNLPRGTKLISLEVNKKDKKINVQYLLEGTREEIKKDLEHLYEQEWFESCKVE